VGSENPQKTKAQAARSGQQPDGQPWDINDLRINRSGTVAPNSKAGGSLIDRGSIGWVARVLLRPAVCI
jgi:hypothetical protein